MTADYDRVAVLAQVAARKAANDARVAEGVDTSPEGVATSVGEQLRASVVGRRKRRAEDAGQLDFGGN